MVNGWVECPITEVLKTNGIKIGPFGSQLKKEMLLSDGAYRVYGQENVYKHDFNLGNRYLTPEHFNRLSSCEILPGDFLMSTMGTVGKCAIVPYTIQRGIMDSHLIRLRFDEKKVRSDYILQLFSDQFHYLSDQTAKLAVGGIMDGLSVGIVSRLKVIYPESIEEQKKIAAVLFDMGNLIRNTEKLIGKLQAVKQACLQLMFPQNGQNEPELRLPEFTGAWEQHKLRDICESFEYGLNAASKEFDGKNKYIRITDIDDVTHEFIQEGITSPDINLENMASFQLKYGDILFARTGASVGKTYIYKESDGLVYYAGFLICGHIKESYNPNFIFQNTLTASYNRFIMMTSQRSGQPGVNAQEYGNFSICTPSLEEQKKIGNYFRTLDNLIILHQRKLKKYKDIKQGMMEELLTGKVRL